MNISALSKKIITERSQQGYLLATKFPELKDLTWKQFLKKLPLELDFITACEMWEALKKI